MHSTRPLFQIDPGWLFVIAGLVMIVASVIIPPHKQLHSMRQQEAGFEAREAAGMERLRAYSEFLARMDEGDDVLTRRLAAAQLNLVPEGDHPVLIAGSASAPVTDWIEATVTAPDVEAVPFPESQLASLVTGEHRHWVLGAASVCLFVGLLLGPSKGIAKARADTIEQRASEPETTSPAPASVENAE